MSDYRTAQQCAQAARWLPGTRPDEHRTTVEHVATHEALCGRQWLPIHFLTTGDERADQAHAEAIAHAHHPETFIVRPIGCTGISPTAHLGRACPIHDKDTDR